MLITGRMAKQERKKSSRSPPSNLSSASLRRRFGSYRLPQYAIISFITSNSILSCDVPRWIGVVADESAADDGRAIHQPREHLPGIDVLKDDVRLAVTI